MSISYKGFYNHLLGEMQTIDNKLRNGYFDEAIHECDDFIAGNGLWHKELPPGIYFNFKTTFYFLKCRALIEKINSERYDDEEYEELYLDLDKNVKRFLYHLKYNCTGKYRKQCEPDRDFLIAEFRYISEEDYEIMEWLEDCAALLEIIKKRRGRTNRLTYVQFTLQISRSCLKKVLGMPDEQIRKVLLFWLNEAKDISQKYDFSNEVSWKMGVGYGDPKMEIELLISLLQMKDADGLADSPEMNQLVSVISIIETRLKCFEGTHGGERSMYIFAIECIGLQKSIEKSSLEEAVGHAKKIVEVGPQFLRNIDDEGLEFQRDIGVIQSLVYSYLILSRHENNADYLSKAIELLENYTQKMRENEIVAQGTARLENECSKYENSDNAMGDFLEDLECTQEELKGLLMALYMPSSINRLKMMCYLFGGNLQKALIYKEEVENNVKRYIKKIDYTMALFYLYETYFFLPKFFRKNQREEEAEKYQKLCVSIINKSLQGSVYEAQVNADSLIYDNLFDLLA